MGSGGHDPGLRLLDSAQFANIVRPLRYAYVYGATPEFEYVGYTPGYLGAFVSDGVVVFGTDWSCFAD
jgi:hypothetical protein